MFTYQTHNSERGFEKIKEACGLDGGPLLEYEINESAIMVLCKACNRYFDDILESMF